MLDERMTISLEEFLKYMMKKWKMVLLIIMIVTACFFMGSIFLGEEITVPHSEEYLHYEQELTWHKSYFEDSVLMNLNPLHIYERSIFLRDISDKDILKNYALSSEIWEEYETEWSKEYLYELVNWNEEENAVELILHHATGEECELTAVYLKEKLLEKDPSLEIVIGAEKIVKDQKLQEEHLRWNSRIDYVNSLLLDAQAGYTLKVSKTVAIVTGGMCGSVLAVCISLISYIFRREQEKI